eukprot:2553240-Rhodomonas_salina.2
MTRTSLLRSTLSYGEEHRANCDASAADRTEEEAEGEPTWTMAGGWRRLVRMMLGYMAATSKW